MGGIFGEGCMSSGVYTTSVSISNCTIEGDYYVGGIAGSNYTNGFITAGHIYNSTIGKSNSNYVGAIVGKTGNVNESQLYFSLRKE